MRLRDLFRLSVIIGSLPVTLTNGTTADATQVMSDLNWIVNQVNANAAPLSNTALLNANNNFTAVQSGLAAVAGANFPIASQVQNWSFNTLSSTLGTNLITARLTAWPLSGYAVGQVFTFMPTNPNTDSVTINIDALGSAVIKSNGAQLVGGELGSSAVMARVSSVGAMPVLDLVGAVPADGLHVTTFTINNSGGTTGSLTLTYQKIGRFVALTIPPALQTSGTSSTLIGSNTALPAALRPVADQMMPCQIYESNAAVAQTGIINITSGGIVNIFKSINVSTAFPNSTASCGLGLSHTITYLVA